MNNQSQIKRSPIEEWTLDRITPYENNAKLHPDTHVDQIAASIEEFTFLDPVAVDETGSILEGHGRVLAAKQRGDRTIPVIQVTGLTEAQKVAYRLAHNKLTMNTGFDSELLKLDFEFLKESDFDLDLTGFDPVELNFDDDSEGSGGGGSGDDDEIPEVVESRVKLGDIWKLGRHFICCGDCTVEENVRKLLSFVGGRSPDMVWADVPYGMNLDTDYSTMPASRNEESWKGGKKYETVIGDNKDYDPRPLLSMFAKIPEIFLWGADYYAERLQDKNNGSWFVWDKRVTESLDKMYGSCFELCWSKKKHKREIIRIAWAGVFGTEKEFDKKRQHPCHKPILLSEWFFEKYSNNNALIIDPYLGSGMSLLAAQKMQGDRTVIGFEISPAYCDVILERYRNLTGDEPKLAQTMQSE
jgi:DNA modification methylase